MGCERFVFRKKPFKWWEMIFMWCYMISMPSHEVYYDLWFICLHELSRLVDNMKIVANAFMVLLSFFWGIYVNIFARMGIFWLIFWTMFKRWSLIIHLLSIATTELIPPTFVCRTFSDLVKRWDFLLLAFKYLFWNDVKTVTASSSSLLNTRSILLHKQKSRVVHVIYVRLTVAYKIYIYI